MDHLTLLSIFRQSELYLDRYLAQVKQTFLQQPGRCHAIWLEGDSTDKTVSKLERGKQELEALGHQVTLLHHTTGAPYWPSRNIAARWQHLASCWNRCLAALQPTQFAVCVESDLIWEPAIVRELLLQLGREHHVIYPKLMMENSNYFYDIWGFSRRGKKFRSRSPHWVSEPHETDSLLQIDSGGGMIATTHDRLRGAHWDPSCCILRFEPGTTLFLDTTRTIYHPKPPNWTWLTPYKITFGEWRSKVFF